MATSFRIEYIILIILCVSYYFYVMKEDYRIKKNKKFINENLKIGSKIICLGGIIGEVVIINDSSIIIVSGKIDKFSYIEITKESIEKIIEA